uniref:Mutator-like transposase domain-containing protein n=1 Tax=Branchiostoma floridae TaxID=7739 RepID=C3XUS6_BRAFL|eukprot:XP_002612142.1 hypothetical protein BRAFLDRAFT_88881 [Branchiostoma floridae]
MEKGHARTEDSAVASCSSRSSDPDLVDESGSTHTAPSIDSWLQLGISYFDNDGKIFNGTNEALREAGFPPVEEQDCVQHNTRNYRNKVFHLCLDVFAGGTNNKTARQEAIRRVGYYIVKRCNKALYTARDHHPDSDVDFFRKLESLRLTIVRCIAGEHSKCTFEFGCPEYIPDSRRPAPDIPDGGNLALSKDDRYALQNLADCRLASETVKRHRNLMSSNKSEAFHNRALKAVPKAVTWKKNYYAAGLADSVRSGTAIRRANESLGVSHPEGSSGTVSFAAIEKRKGLPSEETEYYEIQYEALQSTKD